MLFIYTRIYNPFLSFQLSCRRKKVAKFEPQVSGWKCYLLALEIFVFYFVIMNHT